MQTERQQVTALGGSCCSSKSAMTDVNHLVVQLIS